MMALFMSMTASARAMDASTVPSAFSMEEAAELMDVVALAAACDSARLPLLRPGIATDVKFIMLDCMESVRSDTCCS